MGGLRRVGLATAALLILPWLGHAAPSDEVRVDKTFDGKPFSYRITSVRKKTGFAVIYLTYPSPVATDGFVVEEKTCPRPPVASTTAGASTAPTPSRAPSPITCRVTPWTCLLYTSPSPRDRTRSRMPSSA